MRGNMKYNKAKRKHKKNVNRNSEKIKSFLFIFAIILVTIVITIIVQNAFAKFKSSNVTQTQVYEAKSFYFESDLLKEENSETYTLKKGEDAITIKLKNNVDNLRYSDIEINYVVKITTMDGKVVVDKSGNIVDNKTGILSNNGIEEQEIKFINLPEGNYKVVAESVSPYVKKLQANFSVVDSNKNISYVVNDSKGSPVMRLTVKSNDYTGNIKIGWSKRLAADSSDGKFKDVNSGFEQGSAIIDFVADSEYTFQFFKENPDDVFKDADFSVESVD